MPKILLRVFIAVTLVALATSWLINKPKSDVNQRILESPPTPVTSGNASGFASSEVTSPSTSSTLPSQSPDSSAPEYEGPGEDSSDKKELPAAKKTKPSDSVESSEDKALDENAKKALTNLKVVSALDSKAKSSKTKGSDAVEKELAEKVPKKDLSARSLKIPNSGEFEGQRSLPEDQLSDVRLKELRDAFEEHDKDGSGSIDINELGILMQNIGIKPEDDEIRQMMAAFDKDGNGNVDFDEFCQMIKEQNVEPISDEQLLEFFSDCDKDNGGTISKQELLQVMQKSDPNVEDWEVQKTLELVDEDQSGDLNLDEFRKLMNELLII